METFGKIEALTSKNLEGPKEKLLMYQLEFIDGILDGTIPSKHDNDFLKVLEQYSTISSILQKEYDKRVHEKSISEYELYNEEMDAFVNKTLAQIFKAYIVDKKTWKEKVKVILKDSVQTLGPVVVDSAYDKGQENLQKRKVGLINCNVEHTGELEQFGIHKEENCMSIHFNDLQEEKKKDPDVKNMFSGESFSKLAVKIVEEFPDTRALIADSWMMDSPIGKRLGFHQYFIKDEETKEDRDLDGSLGFWGQFLNADGQINRERIEKFMQSGKPDFYQVRTYMEVEEFLKKYLPKEKRGLVSLKVLTPESIKNLREVENIREKMKGRKLKDLTEEELIGFIQSSTILTQYCKTEEGKKFMEILFQKRNAGEELDTLENTSEINIFEKLSEYIKKETDYTEKKVLIE